MHIEIEKQIDNKRMRKLERENERERERRGKIRYSVIE
jgi:CelD/BcsL family acetyltransferase involved in cellulose biosynthesis